MDLNNLYIVEIEDEHSRENFRKIKDYTLDVFRMKNLKFFQMSFTADVTNFKFRHNLGFLPKDVIQTSLRIDGTASPHTGTLTWNYSLFDTDFVDLTVASLSSGDTLTVRVLIGSLDEDE